MKYVLFGHGGSGNHGCEAIVRTTLQMLPADSDITVYSADVGRDSRYGITDKAKFVQYRAKEHSSIGFFLNKAFYKLTGNYDYMNRFALRDALKAKGAICLSVGGDNYCNAEPRRHASRNKLFAANNKTVLWGCSVTPELMKDPYYVDDMKRYSLITARESITYSALRDAGIEKAVLVSDPAFTLEKKETLLPDQFDRHRVVGINISPLVMKYEQRNSILLKNIETFIQYLLDETEYDIALIPHVLLPNNNDLTPLRILHDEYKGSGRVFLINDDESLNCCELKYVISRCAFMVAARTHASIAAYSSLVPTLVLGYSVKSRGIARDIFGSEDHFVLAVDKITKEDEVKDAFRWIEAHETDIRARYEKVMPNYIRKAFIAKDRLMDL